MTQAISPLRQRMIDDMRMRKFSPKTQNAYIRAVQRFTAFLGRAPDTASDEDLRRYQLHLVVQGISPISLNATITGLKFFFEFTVGDLERMAKMTPVQVPHKLPVILSREEVARLIASGREPEVPGRAIGGLRRRIARQRSHCAEGRRCRQPAHGPAR